ncbi:hypothetical protein ACJX0J_010503, partial [Zea mays]
LIKFIKNLLKFISLNIFIIKIFLEKTKQPSQLDVGASDHYQYHLDFLVYQNIFKHRVAFPQCLTT